MPDLMPIVAFAGAALGFALGVAALLRDPKGIVQWAFLAGMILLGLESLFTGLSLETSAVAEKIVHWQNLRLWATGLLSGTWLLFSLSYARGNYQKFFSKWWPVLAIAYALPVIVILLFREKLIQGWERAAPPYDWYLALNWPGRALSTAFLVSAILILMHLERTLRTSVGTMRWRIKFMVVGLGLLFAVRIYTASQNLLYSSIDLSLQKIDAIALLLACGLMALAFLRVGLAKIDVYPSPRFLQGSATVLLAGVYLLLVGALAQVITSLGGDAAFGFKIFFILASLAILVTLILSERARQYLRRFVSRHFERPHYDYRSVWTTFAERTSFILDKTGLCQAVVKWISETFNVLSVTIWCVDDVNERLLLGASTALSNASIDPLLSLKGEEKQLIQELKQARSPIDLDGATEPWIENLSKATSSFFPNGGRRICLPIVGRGELVGVLTLGDRVKGVPFTVEDFELLKCVGEQVASHLVNIQLSQKLLQVREMEAFQTMAAFFVHDLKNVGSTLSLMMQNLEAHFDNPAFREDALRSLSRSVSHLNNLISRLSLLRQQLELHRSAADLNELVTSALNHLKGLARIKLVRHLQPLPRISIDQEQLHKVVTNLLLNAVEAVGEGGEIHVETARRDSWACLSIQDNGSGMSPEFIANCLFRPFQTTKKKGLGIGVFHSKMIVDAHQGKMEVESLLGKGATFRVLLPLPPEPL